MKYITVAILHLLLLLFFNCIIVSYKEIPADFVYSIKQHGDSIYYSTNSGEIYSINTGRADKPRLIGSRKNHPIRSLLFTNDGAIFTCSYRSGIYKVINDSLCMRSCWNYPAWSMKTDHDGNIWLAGRSGIYKQFGDIFKSFGDMKEAFDLAFYNTDLVVAHYNGISIFDINTGKLQKTLCMDTTCWMTTTVHDSLLICGGIECCIIIDGDKIRTVKLGPKNNIPWACAIDSYNSIFLATEYGLYQIKEGDKKARCIGYHNKCIKSVLIDNNGTLWVGSFFKRAAGKSRTSIAGD
jgi:hypothetical protein